MITDLQKASILKRISAYVLDMILLCTLAVGFGWLLSSLMDVDTHSKTLDSSYSRYEAQYGVTFDITREQYDAMTDAQKENYDTAYDAFLSDEDALYAYNMFINQAMVIVSVGILLAYLVLEFLVPLFLGNGQTVGKKVFSIGLMRVDGVKLTNFSLFVRTVLGKYTIETMVPLLILLLVLLGSLGIVGTVLLLALGIAQIALLICHPHNALIHDLLAATVAVDMQSQMIFRTSGDLIAYKQTLHAENVKKKPY